MCGQDDVLCETKCNTHIIAYKYHVPLIAKIPPFEIMTDFLCLKLFFIQNHVIIILKSTYIVFFPPQKCKRLLRIIFCNQFEKLTPIWYNGCGPWLISNGHIAINFELVIFYGYCNLSCMLKSNGNCNLSIDGEDKWVGV
jgi:hypothetical protein